MPACVPATSPQVDDVVGAVGEQALAITKVCHSNIHKMGTTMTHMTKGVHIIDAKDDGKDAKDAKDANDAKKGTDDEERPKGVVYVKELVFDAFKDANLYDFLEVFVTQGTRRVLQDPTAIGSAMGEIFGGLAQELAHGAGGVMRGLVSRKAQ